MSTASNPTPQNCESCGDTHAQTGCTDHAPICAACCAEFQAQHGPVGEEFAAAPAPLCHCGLHPQNADDYCPAEQTARESYSEEA